MQTTMVTHNIIRRALELLQRARFLRAAPDADLEDLEDAELATDVARDLLRQATAISKVRDKRRMRIGYGDMPHPKHSWWRHLLTLEGPSHDGAWIRFAGVSRQLYDEIVAVASEHPDFRARPDKQLRRGRPMVMGSQDAIGLALRYMIGMSETVGLMSAFFVSSECIAQKLQEGLDMLLWALQRHPDAFVRWPTKEEQEVYSQVIGEHGSDPLPDGLCSKKVMGWVDGFAVRISKPGDKERERMFYSQKHTGCVISNLIAFSPQGTILWYNVNVPGSINDTDACRPLTGLLRDGSRTIINGAMLGDVAFKGEVSGANEVYLTPATTRKFTQTDTVGEALALGFWVLGKRQSVEVRIYACGGRVHRRRCHRSFGITLLSLPFPEPLATLHPYTHCSGPSPASSAPSGAWRRTSLPTRSAARRSCSSPCTCISCVCGTAPRRSSAPCTGRQAAWAWTPQMSGRAWRPSQRRRHRPTRRCWQLLPPPPPPTSFPPTMRATPPLPALSRRRRRRRRSTTPWHATPASTRPGLRTKTLAFGAHAHAAGRAASPPRRRASARAAPPRPKVATARIDSRFCRVTMADCRRRQACGLRAGGSERNLKRTAVCAQEDT
jgi:hypothetical protein